MLFDVLVMGAGPCGASAARRCAEQGLEVALVEQRVLPRYKACGGGVSKKALDAIGVSLPNELVERQVFGFEFASFKNQTARAKLSQPIGITTHRMAFDHFLVRLAEEKGVKLITGKVIDIQRQKGDIRCLLANGETLNGQLVIGADGANGIIARSAGLRERWHHLEVGICFEGEVHLPPNELEALLDPELLYLYYLKELPYGYGWIFPKRDRLSIGIGGHLAALRSTARQLLDAFLRWLSQRFSTSFHPERVYGHLLPAGGIRRRVVTDRVLLAGDAAGFVDPLTGEGIYYAIRSGQLAGEMCVQAMNKGRFDGEFLRQYSSECKRTFGRDLRLAFYLTRVIYPNLHLFFPILFTSQRLHRYVRILACEPHNYRHLLLNLLPRLWRFPQRLILRKRRTYSEIVRAI